MGLVTFLPSLSNNMHFIYISLANLCYWTELFFKAISTNVYKKNSGMFEWVGSASLPSAEYRMNNVIWGKSYHDLFCFIIQMLWKVWT